MFAFRLKHNFNKLSTKSCYQLAKHFITLPNDNPMSKTMKIIAEKQIIPSNHILREISSKSLTIKQYKSSRKYTITWKLERLVGWCLIVVIPMAFAFESKEVEIILATSCLLHTYWGCQSMCSDYLRSSVVGKVFPLIVRLSIVFLSIASLAGAYQLIYKDVGLINMIKEFWSIRGTDYVPPKIVDQNTIRKFTRKF